MISCSVLLCGFYICNLLHKYQQMNASSERVCGYCVGGFVVVFFGYFTLWVIGMVSRFATFMSESYQCGFSHSLIQNTSITCRSRRKSMRSLFRQLSALWPSGLLVMNSKNSANAAGIFIAYTLLVEKMAERLVKQDRAKRSHQKID